MSIYRGSDYRKKISHIHKFAALDVLSSLSGYLSALGKSFTEAWLLKLEGWFDQDSVKKENLKVNGNEVHLLNAKCLCKTLKIFKKSSVVDNDIMKTLMNLPSCCSEGFELDNINEQGGSIFG